MSSIYPQEKARFPFRPCAKGSGCPENRSGIAIIGPLICIILGCAGLTYAQVSIAPAFPHADQEITITYDATQGTSGLVGATRVFMHAGAILAGPSSTSWVNVKGTWGDPGSVGEMTSMGNNKWQIKIVPRTYFGVTTTTRIYRIGMVFRSEGPCGGFSGVSTACKEGKTPANGDIFVDLSEPDQFQVSFSSPAVFPLFKDQGEQLAIVAQASSSCALTVKVNQVVVAVQSAVSSISYTHTISEIPGLSSVEVSADDGAKTASSSFTYVVRAQTVNEARPTGTRDGINYTTDITSVVLSLWAPGKSSVYIRGDFNDWTVQPAYQMKKDGEHFWLRLTGLNAGQEYAFQYLVDEAIYIADPYADKVLDPDDQYIPAGAYPGLKTFPEKARKDQWYFNRASVFQTGQTAFSWQAGTFTKPAKEKLVIYELLIRDFFESNARTYQNLIDTLSYLKRLGINAVELMPVMEFNGNDSWGYNPTFMFAPDKYYGTKSKLKEFIDKAHMAGIAVIMDIAMNHQDIPNPYAMMDFDFTAFKPTAANRWYNVSATHPFSVFNDLNHESAYTKKYLDTVNYYWLHEYRIDGFRFDLSKGFTQKNNPGDVAAWSAYDLSRVAILKRMADKIWSHSPDAYVILEHLGDNVEETELAAYRADEGKGMMLWGKMTDQYNQNTMGYTENSDIASVFYKTRGWTVPHLVGYMESHDEERLMYKNLQFGNTSTAYNVKELNRSIERIKAANLFFYTIPGPKMLWQFGELGYDQSINRCTDGTISNNCRVSPKPVKWDYRNDPARASLLTYTADIIRLRNSSPLFTAGDVTFSVNTTLVKQISLKNKPFVSNPANASQMNAHVVANFDIVARTTVVNFSHPGVWYDYYSADVIDGSTGAVTLSMSPGEYHLFTDYNVDNQIITETVEKHPNAFVAYPNPFSDTIYVDPDGDQEAISRIVLLSATGQEVMSVAGDGYPLRLDTQHLSEGLFIIKIYSGGQVTHKRLVKN